MKLENIQHMTDLNDLESLHITRAKPMASIDLIFTYTMLCKSTALWNVDVDFYFSISPKFEKESTYFQIQECSVAHVAAVDEH